ncbi:MAG: hypothetical protein IJF87_04680 [Erysipelotrichaceae bacterium]|nr:hypothetical protein [Erysipelotrichaceae bacterium]
MKKLFTVLLAGLLLLIAGCSGKNPDISGYYALTEISKDGEVVFGEDQIKEYLLPSFGYMYLDVSNDGTAVLNVAGFDENTVYDWKKKTFTATDELLEETYTFEYKNDQLVLTEQGEDQYVLTFTKAERPTEDYVPPVDYNYTEDILPVNDPSLPGYDIYETDVLKVFVPEDLETYASRDQDYEIVVDGEKVVMFVQSLAISEFTSEEFTLDDVRDAIYEGNDIVDGDLRYMTYTSEADGVEYYFIYSLLNDKVNFYDVTLVCYNEQKDLYHDVMLDILSRIELKNE